MMKKSKNPWPVFSIVISCLFCVLNITHLHAADFDNPDTIIVAKDGSGQFTTIDAAIEMCRAFMDYHKVIYVKNGIYKEKLIIPQWLQNVEICGEDRDHTIITYDDYARRKTSDRPGGIGTFRTYTLRIEGNNITLNNITIENNGTGGGQAVALHTEGDRLLFVNCRFLGNQDTVYTGNPCTRLYFYHCYIEGTTDFIFGPSTAWFECCTIHCKANSYITAASTPKDVAVGYVFNNCNITVANGVEKVYLGRPWRDFGYTLFMHCCLPKEIRKEGWHHWQEERKRTARYFEYENTGEGANVNERVSWAKQLTKRQAKRMIPQNVFGRYDQWNPGQITASYDVDQK